MIERRQIVIAVIVILLLIVIYQSWFKYSQLNTEAISLCDAQPMGSTELQHNTVAVVGGKECMNYNVHREHHDPEAAAQILQELNRRANVLIDHLKEKYLSESQTGDPDKSGRIDVVGGSELFPTMHPSYEQLYASNMTGVAVREFLQERIEQLIRNYSNDRVYEISPLNSSGVTSYAEDKRTLILCLRHKKPNKDGVYELHDIQTCVFVLLHELAHCMNDKMQHTEESNFWPLFKFLLVNATECGIYTPSDYSKKPISYCGMELSYNPYYDARL